MSRCPPLSPLLRSLLCVVCLVCTGPALAQGEPGAADTERVRTLVREAGMLMDRGDRAGAVAKLQQARRIRPDPSLDYNLGVAYAEWGKAAEAAGAFQRFLHDVVPQAVTRDRIEDARRRMQAYEAALPRVSVQLAPGAVQQATVIIDNATLGPLPLAGRFLSPGTHEIRVTASGCRDFLINVTLAAGDNQTITAEPVPLAGGGAFVPDLQRPPPPPPPLYKRWWLWTAVGAGAVVTFGLVGAAAAGRFNHVAAGSDLPPVEVAR